MNTRWFETLKHDGPFMMDLRTGQSRQVLGSLEQQLEELRLESMPQRIFTTSTADSPMILIYSNGIFISENFWSSCPRKVDLLILAAYLVKGTRQSSTSGVTSRSYGISVTTLEEVFLKVASGDAVPRCLAPLRCLSSTFFNEAIWKYEAIKKSKSIKRLWKFHGRCKRAPVSPASPPRPDMEHLVLWNGFWGGKWPWLWFFKSIVIVISV